MSFLTSLAKWKMRWAVFTGVFTLVVFPIAKLVFGKKSKPKASNLNKSGSSVIDVKAEEIK
jgi:hypothetical protein